MAYVPHDEFVIEYRAGRIGMSYDLSLALNAVAQLGRRRDQLYQIAISVAGGATSLGVLALIAALVLQDWWLLIAMATGLIGNFAGAAIHRMFTKGIALVCCVFVFFISAGILLATGNLMPAILSLTFFLVGYLNMVLTYRLAKRVFTKHIFSSKQFYDELLENDLIAVIERGT